MNPETNRLNIQPKEKTVNILETALKYTNNSEYKLFIRFEADPNSGSEVIESMNRVVVGLVSPMFDVKSETSAEAEE